MGEIRPIDANELKKDIEENAIELGGVLAIEVPCAKVLIDNAPTVEPEKIAVANVSFDEDKLKEIVQTEVIDKIKSGDLVIKSEARQQGEWHEHIDKGVLKARHGDYVLYKVDFLLDNLAREVNIMESARKMKGGAEK